MLSTLPEPQLDPILSLSVAYRNDPRDQKVDLGIGVYRNTEGQTPIMTAVSKAQEIVQQTQTTKAYVGLAGCEEFNQGIQSLVLGNIAKDRVATIQTPGASGALRMLGDLIKVAEPGARVWLSNPSYVNHQPVMEAAGLKVEHYTYFCPQTKQVNTEQMLRDLAHAGQNDIVLLHGCCHNPTGADIDLDTWKKLTQMANTQGFKPFVDIAYQGFGDGLEEDALGLRHMAKQVDEMFITTSCSKNFGLYRERTGAAMVIGRNAEHAINAKGMLLKMARATYTMPPDHGAALVKTILQSEDLTKEWKTELTDMRHRLIGLRKSLVTELNDKHGTQAFDFIEQHKGMFTVLGFSQEQMTKLKDQYGIYGVGDGRINIAGLKESDIEYVADAIFQVSK
ncbi:amino acid aminotransferase [Vibrio sp. SCSIO 43136]|uniref:amino acid aminotransferase n=1 Tax=Vibrio sp. SCSIO 43136 TaxID=2819101 RepID=UPI002074EAF4|nr:amino acid aminotransferase [Vibrio sp. SCSIO 43136]USD66738.1 aspartate/tyrosine/aromatic aminotransferase [Vibrio sp. SCSIO 43136]